MKSFSFRPVIISPFGPPSLACIRSWGRKGMSPGMICIQDPGEVSPASKYLTDAICLSKDDLYTDSGLQVIAEFLSEFNASGLICIEEKIALWLNNSRRKLPADTVLWLPTNAMIHSVLDKVFQIETAQNVGLEVLPSYFFSTVKDVDMSIPDEHFPLCLRPSVPLSTTPSFKVENVLSVTNLQNFIESFSIKEPIIGQPFKNYPNLVVHGTRSASNQTIGLEGFIVERKFQGVTLTIKPIDLKDDFKSKCIAFTDKIDIVGHYHFEFLYDPVSGKDYFLEFNFRFGGTTSKVLACGYDEPAYALQAYDVDIPVTETMKNFTVSNIKALIKSLLYALTGRLTPLDYPEESKMRWLWFTLKSLILCKDEIFAWDDLQGTFAFYLGKYNDNFTHLFSKRSGQ